MRKAASRLALGCAFAVLASGARADEGRKVFTELAQPSCTICHTLKAAGAEGTVGPSLDELKPERERAAKAILNGVGAMPPYRDKLTPAQIEAVAGFVARAAGKN